MTKMLDLPSLLEDAGLAVETMDNWDEPSSTSEGEYLWRNPDLGRGTREDDPAASMWHHTATASYVPNRLKANLYVGWQVAGTDRLYQDNGHRPVFVVANAYPGRVTSGTGRRDVLEAIAQDLWVEDRAAAPDDAWAGNRSYWNTEVVLDGVGTAIPPQEWEQLVEAAAILHGLMDWSPARAIGHSQHTFRKVDLWSGQDQSTRETMIRFRGDLVTAMSTVEGEDNMPTFEEFKLKIRKVDIDRMATLNMVSAAEAHYFRGILPVENWKPGNWTPTLDGEFQELYLAYKVRSSLWAGK